MFEMSGDKFRSDKVRSFVIMLTTERPHIVKINSEVVTFRGHPVEAQVRVILNNSFFK
jgi:hypothetical protein